MVATILDQEPSKDSNGFLHSMLLLPGIALIANWWTSKKNGFAIGFANAFSDLGSMVTAFAAIYPLFAKERPSDDTDC